MTKENKLQMFIHITQLAVNIAGAKQMTYEKAYELVLKHYNEFVNGKD